MDLINTFMEWFDGLIEAPGGLLIRMLVFLGACLLIIFIVGKLYGGFLKRKYGFRMFINWANIIAMIGFAYAHYQDFFGREDEFLLSLLLVGAPFMLIYLIYAIFKMRNIVFALICTVLMWFFNFILGYVLGLAAGLVVIAFVGLKLFGVAIRGLGGADMVRVCRNCGARAGTCSCGH